jgi:hypothetical protein
VKKEAVVSRSGAQYFNLPGNRENNEKHARKTVVLDEIRTPNLQNINN